MEKSGTKRGHGTLLSSCPTAELLKGRSVCLDPESSCPEDCALGTLRADFGKDSLDPLHRPSRPRVAGEAGTPVPFAHLTLTLPRGHTLLIQRNKLQISTAQTPHTLGSPGQKVPCSARPVPQTVSPLVSSLLLNFFLGSASSRTSAAPTNIPFVKPGGSVKLENNPTILCCT